MQFYEESYRYKQRLQNYVVLQRIILVQRETPGFRLFYRELCWYKWRLQCLSGSSAYHQYDFINYKKGCTRLAAASDKVYQLLAHGRWFSLGTPASSTTKTGRHVIAEILLKVALSTKNQSMYVVLQRIILVQLGTSGSMWFYKESYRYNQRFQGLVVLQTIILL